MTATDKLMSDERLAELREDLRGFPAGDLLDHIDALTRELELSRAIGVADCQGRARAQAERDEARRELCEVRGRFCSPGHGNPGSDTMARSIARKRGWGYLYPDSEASAPGGAACDECIEVGSWACSEHARDDEPSAPGLTDEQARELARRWAAPRMCDESCGPRCGARRGAPDEAEREALFAWVRARMSVEASRRHGVRVATCRYRGFEGADPPAWPVWDGLPDDDREALAHAVMNALGSPFKDEPHGEHGLAWALCEAAGWPS